MVDVDGATIFCCGFRSPAFRIPTLRAPASMGASACLRRRPSSTRRLAPGWRATSKLDYAVSTASTTRGSSSPRRNRRSLPTKRPRRKGERAAAVRPGRGFAGGGGRHSGVRRRERCGVRPRRHDLDDRGFALGREPYVTGMPESFRSRFNRRSTARLATARRSFACAPSSEGHVSERDVRRTPVSPQAIEDIRRNESFDGGGKRYRHSRKVKIAAAKPGK